MDSLQQRGSEIVLDINLTTDDLLPRMRGILELQPFSLGSIQKQKYLHNAVIQGMFEKARQGKMANLNSILNERISRVARKEIKFATGSTKRLAIQHRRDVAMLKRQIKDLKRRLAFVEAQAKRTIAQQPAADLAEGARFSARSVKAQRSRLGLSAEKFGKLFGVTGLTVYSWESGKFRPKKEQLAKLVTVRKIGKREAFTRLKMLGD